MTYRMRKKEIKSAIRRLAVCRHDASRLREVTRDIGRAIRGCGKAMTLLSYTAFYAHESGARGDFETANFYVEQFSKGAYAPFADFVRRGIARGTDVCTCGPQHA